MSRHNAHDPRIVAQDVRVEGTIGRGPRRPPILNLRLVAYATVLGIAVLLVALLLTAALCAVPSSAYTLVIAGLGASLCAFAAIGGIALNGRRIVSVLICMAIASVGPVLLLLALDIAEIVSLSQVSCSGPDGPVNCDPGPGLAIGLVFGSISTFGLWAAMACVALASRFGANAISRNLAESR